MTGASESRRRVDFNGIACPLEQVLQMVDGLFDPGTPIPAAKFMDGVSKLLHADQSALVLVKLDARYNILRVIDHSLHNVPHISLSRFDEDVMKHKVWTNDPVARMLHQRCVKRPDADFVFSTRKMARGLDGDSSFSIQFLDKMGAKHEITSLQKVEGRTYSLLTFYRMSDNATVFTRGDRRLLKLMHRSFASRIIDLRDRTIREQLPVALRHTFSMMLAGSSEKQIAIQVHRSKNTVHSQIKRIYTHFHVSSRNELMSRFVDMQKIRDAMGIVPGAESDADVKLPDVGITASKINPA